LKPNLIIPLASSYDQRFPAGYTGVVAGYDQRKVNCYYEVVDNALTGKKTLILAKRAGVVTGETIDDYGSGTQVPYLCQRLGATGAMPLLIVKDSNDTKAVYPTGVGTTASVTILSDADYAPNYISTTNISGTTYYVLQLRENDSEGATDEGVQKVYYSSNLSSWTEITDTDFTTPTKWGKMVHMDGYSFILGSTGIYGSDLNSISAWRSANFIAKSTEQDFSMGLIQYNDRILAFGERTCEQFYNAGNAAGSPLSRVTSRVDRIGLSSRFMHFGNSRTEYHCIVENRVFFLGTDTHTYSTSLMTYNGSVFERVSGEHEDRLIQDAYGVFSVVFQGRSAVAILLTAPGAETARWLMFFPEFKSWFEWESTVFTAINSGSYFAGVADPNKLFAPPFGNTWTDDGTNYQFLTQFRLPTDDDEWKTMARCGVQADKVSTTLDVKFNDGGAATYSAARSIDLSKATKEIYRCGAFKERYVQFSNTSDKQIRLRSFYANVE
jgi:hypothetical protein